MKRVLVCLLVVCSLAALRGQSRDAIRLSFERLFPTDGTYAVVVRSDLPTVSINGARGRERGKARLTLEISDERWKQEGSLGREPATGTLHLGEIVKLEEVHYGDKEVELRLQSTEPHDIVRDPDKPEKNRREPVATVLKVPRTAGMRELLRYLDGYIRLCASREEAAAYARSLAERQPDRRFTLAVMRRDGLLVPFASYDNGHWYSRWPVPTTDRDVPVSLSDVPANWWGIEGPASVWTLWTPDGKPRPVRVTGTLGFEAHCVMNVGLRTDYRSPAPAPPLDQHNYPKDGLAITGSLPIEQATVITAADPVWKSLEQMLRGNVTWEERWLLARFPGTDPHFRKVAPGVTAMDQVPLKLEVLCSADGLKPNTLTVYFEGAKRYEAEDANAARPCGPVTFSSGWVHRAVTGQGFLDNNVQTRLTDCTQWNIDFRQPLGIVRVGGKPYWIMQVSRWGGESYEVVEVGENRTTVVLTTVGGWCKTLGN
jgi:hypothetical protein